MFGRRLDLVSGNINYVFYQKGANNQDLLIHHYKYDSDNRIKTVETSIDGWVWNQEAKYHYYQHGPLARTGIGHYAIQGQDYFYTLQGWLKGMNLPGQEPFTDPGRDGAASSPFESVNRDEMAFTLGYYEGDYRPIGTEVDIALVDEELWHRNTLDNTPAYILYDGSEPLPQLTEAREYIRAEGNTTVQDGQTVTFKAGGYIDLNPGFTVDPGGDFETLLEDSPKRGYGSELYNGNIAWMVTDVAELGRRANDPQKGMQTMLYNYDQLNRITKARGLTSYQAGNGWEQRSMFDQKPFDADYSYDPNGNLLNLNRRNELGELKEELSYHYEADMNRLLHVNNTSIHAGKGGIANQNAGNYTYDEVGNLIQDQSENIRSIEWNISGKVTKVLKENGGMTEYRYDAAGNRIYKAVTVGGEIKSTHYVRDASGNTMAVYENSQLKEQGIFGSSRVGLYRGEVEKGKRILGRKQYELSNHLGNVLAVVTDNKKALDTDANGTADQYLSKVVSATDYYPFGSDMPSRNYSDENYRYGFNGKENDKDFGNQHLIQDYGFRLYNPEIGKFLSVDPLTKSFPMLTPYQFASNTPIMAIDLDGLEASLAIGGGTWASPPTTVINGNTTTITGFISPTRSPRIKTEIKLANSYTLNQIINNPFGDGATFEVIGVNPAPPYTYIRDKTGKEFPISANEGYFRPNVNDSQMLRNAYNNGELSGFDILSKGQIDTRVLGAYREYVIIGERLPKVKRIVDIQTFSSGQLNFNVGSTEVNDPVRIQEIVNQLQSDLSRELEVIGSAGMALSNGTVVNDNNAIKSGNQTWGEFKQARANSVINAILAIDPSLAPRLKTSITSGGSKGMSEVSTKFRTTTNNIENKVDGTWSAPSN
ncbi:RHS repeat-associated core domain-containing protein [Rapidithrix thailandica]|uniref:RHS repeat-associated core domain-containing protein n=1 Tax=Rapidithrix thailandica TaxID=413964 RepID=A0AAW9SAL0_9BACT